MKPPHYRKAAALWPFRCRSCVFMEPSGRCRRWKVQVRPEFTCSTYAWRP